MEGGGEVTGPWCGWPWWKWAYALVYSYNSSIIFEALLGLHYVDGRTRSTTPHALAPRPGMRTNIALGLGLRI